MERIPQLWNRIRRQQERVRKKMLEPQELIRRLKELLLLVQRFQELLWSPGKIRKRLVLFQEQGKL